MEGGKQKSPMRRGFTIIEVMIFLAISGVTFLIAMGFINGKESQAEFVTGMNSSSALIRTLINNVANGDYPLADPANLSCYVNGGKPSVSNLPPPHNIPNSACSLIGKVIAPETNINPNQNPNRYSIFSVVGCSFVGCSTTGQPPTSLSQEQPTVATLLTQSNNWPGGIIISKLWLVNSDGTIASSIGAFGVFSSLPQSSNGVLVSGAQSTQAVYVGGTQLSSGITTITTQVKTQTSLYPNSEYPNAEYVVMCFVGSNNQKGSISVGGVNGGGQLNSTLQMGATTAIQC